METKNEEMKELHYAYLIVTLCCSPRGSADDPCCKALKAAVCDGVVAHGIIARAVKGEVVQIRQVFQRGRHDKAGR